MGVVALAGFGTALHVTGVAQAQDAPAAVDVPKQKKKEKKPDLVKEFYASGAIPQLRLEISKEQLDALRKNPRVYNQCSVKGALSGQEDTVLTEVGIKLKGQAGSFRNVDEKPGITLNFNKFKKGQKFYGLDKFHLNNSVQDATMLNEALAGSIMRDAGVPAARCTHARVWLNGRDMGVYVLKESFEEDMLKGFFKDRSGTMFEGNFVSDIDNPPVQKNNDANKDSTKIKQLLESARQADQAKRRGGIGQVLDVERFMTLMALEAMICHWDGYAFNRNNYRLYHDPESDKLVFLPHGMDQVFGQLGMPLQGGGGIVVRALLEMPDERARYYDRVAELRQSVLDPDKLGKRVDEMSARLLPTLRQISAEAARQHEEQAKSLKERIVHRAREIDRQLAGMPRPLRFDAAGVAAIANWQPRVEGNVTGDRFDEGGKPRLRIKSGGAVNGSFRTTVLLPRGKYVFEGQARAVGINAPSGPGSGAGLRISGGQRATGLVGDTGWQKVEIEFEVSEPQRDVTLVCELRANAGEAQFDAESLKLRKR